MYIYVCMTYTGENFSLVVLTPTQLFLHSSGRMFYYTFLANSFCITQVKTLHSVHIMDRQHPPHRKASSHEMFRNANCKWDKVLSRTSGLFFSGSDSDPALSPGQDNSQTHNGLLPPSLSAALASPHLTVWHSSTPAWAMCPPKHVAHGNSGPCLANQQC